MGRGHAEGHKNETQRDTGGRSWSFTDCMAGEISPKMCIMCRGQVGTRMGVDGYRGIWMGAVQLGGMYEHGKGAQRDRNGRGGA